MNIEYTDKMKVLMVHEDPCIRVLKETQALCKNGVTVDVLCLNMSNTPQLRQYVQEVYTCATLEDMHTFLQGKHCRWDIIHCHNEPNIITVLALSACTERPVIYDCHDMTSARSPLQGDESKIERLCFTRSQGVVHVSERLKKLAFREYGPALAIVLPSYPLASESRIGAKPKLRGIHVVYQGGIKHTPDPRFSYRYYLPMFKKIVEAGMHLHVFPSQSSTAQVQGTYDLLAKDNSLFHLHESLPYEKLITTMSQFQWGFSGFNFDYITDKNTINFLNSALPNKFFDYLLAGVCPVVINNKTAAEFAVLHGIGYTAENMDDFVRICMTLPPLPPMQNIHVFDMNMQISRLIALYHVVCQQFQGGGETSLTKSMP